MNIISRSLRAGAGTILKNFVAPSAVLPNQIAGSGSGNGLIYQQNLITKFYFASQATSHEAIEKLVKHNKVVIFMKGVPDQPRCGFSNAVVRVLEMHGIQNYDAHDVLADEGLRQGIKDYSSWPTIPQVYISGEFIGGCDIILEMHKNGELVEQLKKAGIRSALLDADEHKGKADDSTIKK